MKNKILTLLIISLISLVLVSFVKAQDERGKITIQGRLTDASGNPLTGTYNFNFSIYNSSTGGSLLWSQLKQVQVNNGIFSTEIGPIDLTFDIPYYLEVKIGNEVLQPRYNLTAAPYSFISIYGGTGGISGSISPDQIAFGTSVNTIGGDNSLSWDNVVKRLRVEGDAIFVVPSGKNGNAIQINTSGVDYATIVVNGSALQIWSNKLNSRGNLWVRNVSAEWVNSTGVCLSNDCKSSWPVEAPIDASYVTLGLSGTLTSERVLAAGAGITISDGGANGNVIVSHTDTSSQSSVDNSGGTVIQDITLDTFGHVTGLASVNLDNRFVSRNDWTTHDNYPSACPAGQFVTGIGDTLTCASPPGGIGGSGTATQVAFFTGATTIGSDSNLYWDNTNKRLGIGTTTPAVSGLHIGSSVIGGQAQVRLDNSNGQYGGLNRWTDRLEIMSSNAIGFATPNVGDTRMWIASNGNVGIGTTTPNKKLDVSGGSVKISGNLGSYGYDPDSGYPSGWGGGVHTFDIAAEGSIAARQICLDTTGSGDGWSGLDCRSSWPIRFRDKWGGIVKNTIIECQLATCYADGSYMGPTGGSCQTPGQSERYVLCPTDWIVISGGGDCGAEAIMKNQPYESMAAWIVGCETTPPSVRAICCR